MADRLPPGPRDRCLGLSFIQKFRRDPLTFITEVGRTYGDVALLRLGPIRAVFINHPELIREVLVTKAKQFRKVPKFTRKLAQIDGNGLINSEGPFWLRQRRLVQPAFHQRRFGRYAEQTVEYTRRMLDHWPDRGEVRMVEEMTHLTLAIIARTLFDLELEGEAARLGEAERALSEIFVAEMSSVIDWPDWAPFAWKRRKRWAIRMLDDLIRNTIRERRTSGRDHGDLLSMLLLAADEEGDGRGMTDEQARDEAMTLFNAGHDSTAAALAWIWYCISQHDEVEERLLAEAREILGGRLPTFDDFLRLEYAQQVVKETLRLYPPTWALLAREPICEVELGGYRLPRGCWIYLLPWLTQRDPRFFERPETFDPDRFSPDRKDAIAPFAYFPFGGGPHVCIGNTFAMMEMTLIVPTVLQQFRLQLAPGQEPVRPEPLIAVRPKGSLTMRVERRAAS